MSPDGDRHMTSDSESIRGFYDERWADAQFINTLKLQRASALLRRLASLRLDAPRIADVGSGTGWLTSMLGSHGPAHGYDLSGDAVERARLRYPNLAFDVVDLEAAPCFDETELGYDVVISHEVLEHMADQRRHCRLLLQMLRPGGWLLATTPNRSTFDRIPRQAREVWSQQPIEHWLTAKELRALLTEAGFSVESLSTVILGQGKSLVRDVAFSNTVRGWFDRVRLLPTWEQLLCDLGLGLHLVVTARRAPR